MNHDPGKYLLDALVDEKAIVIEQVGTLSLKYQPAQPDNSGKALLPPSYQIGFQTRRMQDDQVFSHYLEVTLGITFIEAQALYRSWCALVYETLHAGRKVALQSIGELSIQDGTTVFEPYEYMNMFDDAFGLEKVEFSDSKVQNEREKSKKQKKKGAEGNINHVFGTFLLFFTICIIGALVLAWFNPFDLQIFQPFRVKILSFFPKEPISIEINGPGQNSEILDDSATRTRHALFYEEQKTAPSTARIPAKSATPEANISAEKPVENNKAIEDKYAHCKDFYLIAGSFDTRTRAVTMVNKLSARSLSAEVIQMQGKYRVSIGHFTKRSEALLKLEELRKNPANKEVWLLSL